MKVALSDRTRRNVWPLLADAATWPRPALALLLCWLLCMIFVPIARWLWGEAAVLVLIQVSVLLQAGAVFAFVSTAWGWRRTTVTLAVVAVVTFLVEYIGSHTGLIFGDYAYTDRLQPQVGGVPLLIPLAWFMMLPAAWAVAGGRQRPRWQMIVLAGLALTAWDLMLDPQMVGWQLWQWTEPGGYFGIPWQNFLGWFLTAALLTWLLRPQAQPALPRRPLLLIFSVTWFLEWFGLAFFWGQPGPALVGGVVMGLFVWLGWRDARPA